MDIIIAEVSKRNTKCSKFIAPFYGNMCCYHVMVEEARLSTFGGCLQTSLALPAIICCSYKCSYGDEHSQCLEDYHYSIGTGADLEFGKWGFFYLHPL